MTRKAREFLHAVTHPLNARQRNERFRVQEELAEFFQSPKFKKGWAIPPFSRASTEHEFHRAAEIAVRVRAALDAAQRRGAFKRSGGTLQHDEDGRALVRLRIGSAHEYLESLDHKPDSDELVSGLVHHIFKDSNGYVEGLTAQRLDTAIERINAAIENSERAAAAVGSAETRLADAWAALSAQFETYSKFVHNGAAANAPHPDAKRIDQLATELQRLADCLASEMQVDTLDDKDGAAAGASSATPASSESKAATAAPVAEPAPSTVAPMHVDSAMSPPPAPMDEETEPRAAGSDSETEGAPRAELENLLKENLLKIERVRNDVSDRRRDILELRELVSNVVDGHGQADSETHAALARIQKRAVMASEQLMQDLTRLDEVVTAGNEESLRPVRKAQVQDIQKLLDEADALRQRVKAFADSLPPPPRAPSPPAAAEPATPASSDTSPASSSVTSPAPTPAPAESSAPSAAPATTAAATPAAAAAAPAVPDEESSRQTAAAVKKTRKLSWSDLKLQPKIDVQELRSGYTLQSYIPGLDRDDISVNVNDAGDVLTLKGVRRPQPAEQEQLRRQLAAYLQRMHPAQRKNANEEEMLLRLGAGRFGSFEAAYELPADADVTQMAASYNGGVLKVVVPKKRVVHRAPVPQQLYGMPYGGGYGWAPRDRDMFW